METAAPRAAGLERPTRLAFVGYMGHQGAEYLRAVELLENVAIVALVDTIEHRPPDIPAVVPHFSSTRQMLDSVVPDVTIVTVPHDIHYGIISELVLAGSHVIVEKPLVPDSASARKLYDLSRRTGRSIVTTTQRPLRPEFRYLERVLREIGPIYWAEWKYHMAFSEPSKGWRAEWQQARGGVLLDMGYHALDVLVRLLGQATPFAATKRYRYDQSRSEGLEDLMSVSLDFNGGEIGCHLLVARHARQKSESFELHGARGIIDVDVRHPSVTVYREDGTILDQYIGSSVSVDAPALVLGSYLTLANSHIESLKHLRHHVNIVEVCEESYRLSANTSAA